MPLVTKPFSNIITFTRASNATRFNSAGNLVYAPNNWIRNNTMQGAVAGTPGTSPTNWVITSTSGLSTSIVGTGTQNGINYIDVRVFGTTTAASSFNGIYAEGNTVVAASNGQTWTYSSWVSIVGGSTANLTALYINHRYNDGAGTVLTNQGTSLLGATSSLTRYTSTFTAANASTAFVSAPIAFQFNNGVAIDITLRIGLPQLEIGPTANAVIPTSGTAYNGPRFDYDPTTLAARGLLIEEARTNLLTYSADFSDVSWTKTDVTITADNTTDPAGTTTADLLTEGTAGTAFTTRAASPTVAAGATVSSSVFVKRSAVIQWLRVRVSNNAATNGGNVWFDIQNGVLGNQTNVGSGTGTVGTITAINNGWYRITATTTLTAGDTTASTGFCSASANGSTTRVNNSAYWLWGAQLEAGAFPTSYIPTTTTALTRSADDARVNVLSPWYNQSAGTLFVERIQQPIDTISARRYINVCDGTTANSIQKYQSTGGISAAVTAVGGVASFGPSPAGVPAQGSIVKTALSFDGISKSMCRDAGTVFTDVIAPPTSGMTTMFIGSQLGTAGPAVQFSCTWIRRITYYPRRLSNAELVSITS